MSADPDDFRLQVMLGALDLFEAKGYETTTVDEIADAVGMSRRTFFRQFRAKEDVVFVDHELAVTDISRYLADDHDDPRAAVVDAAMMVFDRFASSIETTERRYHIVKDVPVLRDREIVMTFRYEGLFTEYLRRTVPEVSEVAAVQFAAAVTATHNYLLRRFLRHRQELGTTGSAGSVADTRAHICAALSELLARFERSGGERTGGERSGGDRSDEVVVAVFPRGAQPQAILDALSEHL